MPHDATFNVAWSAIVPGTFLLPEPPVKPNRPAPRPSAGSTDDLAHAVFARLQDEVEDLQPLVTPIWLGCKIGRNVSVLRDQESGLLTVWGPGTEAGTALPHDVGIGRLFCVDSPWMDGWVKDVAIRGIRDVDPSSSTFRTALRRASSLFRRSAAARRASRRVLDALDLEPGETRLALCIDPSADGEVSRISFRLMQNVLMFRDMLVRLAQEQPHWLTLAATWLGDGLLHPGRDLMAQIKGLARTRGLSRDAWRSLAALGDRLLDDLPPSFRRSGENLPDIGDEPLLYFATAKARHWVGSAWTTFHPGFRASLVRVLLQYPDPEALEPLIRAVGDEAGKVQHDLEGLVALENEFRELIRTLDYYRLHEADFAVEHESILTGILDPCDSMPMPPTSTRMRAWRQWRVRARNHVTTPFWTPIARIDAEHYVAHAIATRAQLIEHGQSMANCASSYATRCAMGTYVIYDIRDRTDSSVATLGLKVQRRSSPGIGDIAVAASIDELSGHGNAGVPRRIRHFGRQVLREVCRKLEQEPGRQRHVEPLELQDVA